MSDAPCVSVLAPRKLPHRVRKYSGDYNPDVYIRFASSLGGATQRGAHASWHPTSKKSSSLETRESN